MAKEQVVYALTSGEYSDYSVEGICLNRVKAEKLAEQSQTLRSYWNLRVEEIPLMDEAEFLPVYRLEFHLDEDGNIIYEHETSELEIVVKPSYEWRYVWGYRAQEATKYHGRFWIHGANIKRMRKVYSEKKAWLKASEVERRMNHAGRGR